MPTDPNADFPGGACPLCGSKERTPLAEQCVPALSPEPEHDEWPVLTIGYQACADCGTVSQHPLPATARLDQYYASVHMVRHVPASARAMDEVYRDRLELLRRVTDLVQGEVLEVGCGNGLLLQMIADQWGLSARGLEPSASYDTEPVVPIAHSTLQDFAPARQDWPDRYELVVCRHVLEHVPAPGAFLSRLASLIAPEGWLYLEVPSSVLHARAGLPASGQNIHAVHLHHYSGPGLAGVLAALGLTTLHLEDRAVANYPALCLAARLGWNSGALFRAQLAQQQRRYATAADKLVRILQASRGAPILVWGAGADLGQVLPLVPADGRVGLQLYDRSSTKQGRCLDGLEILDEAQLTSLTPECVVAGCGNASLVEDIRADAASRFPQVPFVVLFADETP